VARAYLDSDRHTLELPLGDAPSESQVAAVVTASPDTVAPQSLLGGSHRGERCAVVPHGDDDRLNRRNGRWQPQAGIVAVAHDQATDHPGRGAPRGRPAQLA